MSTYVPPPPPPPPGYGQPNNNANCFKWGAFGCGGCLLLAIIAGFLIYKSVGGFIGSAMKDSMQVSMDLHMLRQQIMKYKEDTGQYPDKLEDLVPKYVQSSASLRPATHPEGPAYTYHKPTANAEPDDVLLEYTIKMTTPDGEKVEVPVRMQINGRTRQGGSTVTPAPGRARRGSFGQPATSGGD